MQGFGITCKCGNTADHDQFELDANRQPLPRGSFRCPDCAAEWSLVRTGYAQILPNGLHIPAPRQVVEKPRRAL